MQFLIPLIDFYTAYRRRIEAWERPLTIAIAIVYGAIGVGLLSFGTEFKPDSLSYINAYSSRLPLFPALLQVYKLIDPGFRFFHVLQLGVSAGVFRSLFLFLRQRGLPWDLAHLSIFCCMVPYLSYVPIGNVVLTEAFTLCLFLLCLMQFEKFWENPVSFKPLFGACGYLLCILLVRKQFLFILVFFCLALVIEKTRHKSIPLIKSLVLIIGIGLIATLTEYSANKIRFGQWSPTPIMGHQA